MPPLLTKKSLLVLEFTYNLPKPALALGATALAFRETAPLTVRSSLGLEDFMPTRFKKFPLFENKLVPFTCKAALGLRIPIPSL